MSIRKQGREVQQGNKRRQERSRRVAVYKSFEATETFALDKVAKEARAREDEDIEINSKIPDAASADNQLADQAWVEQKVDENASYYITADAAGNPFATREELVNAETYWSGGERRIPTRNDYAVVLDYEGVHWRFVYAVPHGYEDESSDSESSEGESGRWEPQYPIESTDYRTLSHKPSINDVELDGNKTGAELGLASEAEAEALRTSMAGLDETLGEVSETAQKAYNAAQIAQEAAHEAEGRAVDALSAAENAYARAGDAIDAAAVASARADRAEEVASEAYDMSRAATVVAASADSNATQALAKVASIEDMIPEQASPDNQLADKDFVNSSIATNTATFRGTSDAETLAAFEAWLATIPAENNDYVFWQTEDAEGNTVYKRYKYSAEVDDSSDSDSDSEDEPLLGHWLFEYELNNSSFTAEQWAAINSGITEDAVTKLGGIAAGAQANVIETVKVNGTALTPQDKAVNIPVPTLDNTVTPTSANGVKSSGIWSALWGALAALPTGFASLYDWVVAQLAGKADKSDVDPLLFSQYYPDGSVTSAAEFTTGIKYDDPDTTNRTITVKPFSNTGNTENDNSSLDGRVVIPPFVDAQGNGYISDDGTRFKVVEVSGGVPHGYSTNLTAVIAPNTVTTIGSGAFRNCSLLASVSLSAATTIRGSAFSDCSALTSVSLPSATSIGGSAFTNCTSLASVSLPSATTIGDYAFRSCTSLASVSIPAAASIGSGVFNTCSSLASVSLPAATSIGTYAFNSCTKLASVSIPAATNIRNYAFYSCTKLASVSLPAATSIGGHVFDACTKLASVSLPAATSIGGSAFNNCNSLASVSLPAVTSLDGYSFAGCSSLTSVDFGVTLSSVPTLGSNAFNNVPKSCKIIVPDSQYDAWIAASGWSTLYANGYKFLRHSEWEYARKYELDGKLDSSSVAPAFTATTYAADDACTYNGVRYKCILGYTADAQSAKPDADSTHWTVATVEDVLEALAEETTPIKLSMPDDCFPVKYVVNGETHTVGRDGIVLQNGPNVYLMYDNTTSPSTLLCQFSSSTLKFKMPSSALTSLVFGTEELEPDRGLNWPRLFVVGGAIVRATGISAEWKAGTAYAVPTLALHDGSVYRCIADHTAGAAWDKTKWVPATVQDILALKADKAEMAGLADEVAQKADITQIAPEFSENATYAEGKRVSYEGVVYVCTAAVETAGAWTGSANWSPEPVSGALEDIEAGLEECIGSGSQIPVIYPIDTELSETSTNPVQNRVVTASVKVSMTTPQTTVTSESSGGTTAYVRSVTLADRSMNSVVQGTDGEGHPITEVRITCPPRDILLNARNFVLVLDCDQQQAPTISFASAQTVFMEDASELAPEVGLNVYSFTEFAPNKYIVSRRLVVKASENRPKTGDELAQFAGVPDAEDFGEIATALELADDATVEDAVDAAMQR